MDRTRLKSELLATLRLGAGDGLAVADVLAALVAWPDRAGEPLAADRPSAPAIMATATRALTRLRGTDRDWEPISRRFQGLLRQSHPGQQ